MVDFSKLPIELINIIINYTDVIVCRNGQYLNRITKDDKRYNIIKKIKVPIYFGNNIFYFRFYINNNKRVLVMEHKYNSNNNHHYLIKREIKKQDDGPILVENESHYIFDLQGECRKIVNYTM